MIGKTLSNYEIIGTLGSGGMGTVYLARDVRLGRTVALKVLPEGVAGDEVRRKRFHLEARSASALNHPNVAHVYDVGEALGVSYIVMEHIEGETLAEKLSHGPLTVAEALDIATQVADGLAEAHRRQIVHRDIKPANIMLTERARVKVLDFGLARLEGGPDLSVLSMAETVTELVPAGLEMTTAGQVLGTVPYMSPEQALGERIDARSDIFSFGIVFYEMLTGVRPFAGRTVGETVESICSGKMVDVSMRNPSVPPAVAHIVRTCLEPDPAGRYSEAEGLFRELKLLAGSAIPTAPAAPANPAGRDQALSRIESIAVMPFDSGGKDEDTDYLCDGLAENLIARLARLRNLKVVSRYASFALRDESRDPALLGKRLDVEALVFGDLKQRGDRLIVNVELVGVPDGRRLWGDRYDRPLSEAHLIEKDVAENVTGQLMEALSSDEQARSSARDVHPQAYLLYLKGRSLLIGSAIQMKKGEECLREAVERDPGYALPHAALVESYLNQAYHGTLDPQEARLLSREAARTAVRLDPDLPEALTALGIVLFMFDWDWKGADESFRKAVAMGPGRDVPHLEYAEFLAAMGRLPEALKMASRARELDPVSPNPTHLLAYTLMLMGDLQGAVREFRAAISLHPNWIWGHIKLAMALSRSGDHDEALREVEIAEAALHGSGTPLARSWLGRIYAAAGHVERAREILAQLVSTPDRYVDPLTRAYVLSGLGEVEAILDCIDRAFRERSPLCANLKALNLLLPELHLHENERFQAILRKMGLSED